MAARDEARGYLTPLDPFKVAVRKTGHPHLAGQGWAGLTLIIVGILAAATKELFTG